MRDFSQQYRIIYDFFKKQAEMNQKPFSKLDLARLLGISQGRMQKWEKGQRPNALDCLTIHKKLGFELEWLIADQGEMFRTTQVGVPVKTAIAADPTAQDLAAKVHELEAVVSSLRQELIDSQKESLALYRQQTRSGDLDFTAQTGKESPPSGKAAVQTATISPSARQTMTEGYSKE